MNDAQMEGFTRWLSEVHAKHRDGCKASCGERSIGYHHSDYDESYWFVRFGGYCLGALSRNVEVRAPNTTMLEEKVRKIVNDAIIESKT